MADLKILELSKLERKDETLRESFVMLCIGEVWADYFIHELGLKGWSIRYAPPLLLPAPA